jgi:hypothetical protein
MPDAPTESDGESGLSRDSKIRVRRLNEHLRFLAQTFDRLGTLVVGGAVLAPWFQHQQPQWRETIV